MKREPRSLAFYLPQFHPIPENDEWWGRGFTEWSQVVRGRPRYRGHYQPHLPADLGFYDLRLPEVRKAQAELARGYGVSGFVYYHYWFAGRRVLERPLDEVVAAKEPDFPFCVCWANENWTRRWDGSDWDVLLAQQYSPEDDVAHLEYLCQYFDDPRYVRIDGRPLFIVYHADHLPDASSTTRRWRNVARAQGVGELYLACVESFGVPKIDPRPSGFDTAVEFQPDFARTWRISSVRNNWHRALDRLGRPPAVCDDYRKLVPRMLERPVDDYPRWPGVTPSWDNTARAKRRSLVLANSTPELFEQWLYETLARSPWRGDADLVFVNAWNEWAEGAHLEPDERYGHAWLQAHAGALQRIRDRDW